MSTFVDDDDNYPQIQWTTPMSHLIRDDFMLEDDHMTTHATLEDALSHRTGMPRHDDSYGGLYDGHAVSPKDVVRSLRYLPLTAELRTKWQYCNMMFVVIAHIIQTITESRLEDVIRKRILRPLGMKNTYFSVTEAINSSGHLATGYTYSNGSYHEVPDFNLTEVSGAGFMISSAEDYTIWLRAMINQTPPISKAGHHALKTPRIHIESPPGTSPYTGPTSYALGWVTGVYRGHLWYQHSGAMEAYGANVIFFPEIKYGTVSFGNVAGSSNAAEEALMWHLIDEKLQIPEEDRFDWNKKSGANAESIRQFEYFKLTHIKRNQDAWDKQARVPDKAREDFYPNIPNPPIPLSLPLEKYEGTYWHPAYHNMTVVFDPERGKLRIDRSSQTWATALELEHVSGEYFVAFLDSTTAPHTPVFKSALPAEFRLGKEGRSEAFGARMEPLMVSEKIWFDRI
jgi:hypothetical protein